MKHDLEAFSRDIVALIKTSGDTGDTGDHPKKSLEDRDNFVPPRRAEVSPLGSEWGRAVAACGDRKSQHLQPVVDSVPSVSTATAHLQGGTARVSCDQLPRSVACNSDAAKSPS